MWEGVRLIKNKKKMFIFLQDFYTCDHSCYCIKENYFLLSKQFNLLPVNSKRLVDWDRLHFVLSALTANRLKAHVCWFYFRGRYLTPLRTFPYDPWLERKARRIVLFHTV